MRNWFVFGDLDSRDYGVYISGQGTFGAGERDYNFIPVPGRDGDLLGIESRLKNVDVTFPAYIYRDFPANVARFRAALLSRKGYQRLTTSYHPDEYRMATFVGPFEPDVNSTNSAGQFEIVFNCKPQRFLTSGEQTVTIMPSAEEIPTIENPTQFDAQPLIRVYGTGTLQIGSQTITITHADSYTDIDCAMMDCFEGTVSKNAYVQFSGNDFPVLPPGVSGILLGTGISQIRITPRWWTV